jgi:ZIP family zinc transporter
MAWNLTSATIFCLLFITAMNTLGAGLVFIFRKDMSPPVRAGILGFAGGLMLSASAFGLMGPSFEEALALGVPYPYWLPGFVGFAVGCFAVWGLGYLIPLCTGHDEIGDVLSPAPLLDGETGKAAPAGEEARAAGEEAAPAQEEAAPAQEDASPAPGGGEEARHHGYDKAIRLALAVFLHNLPEGIAVGLTLGLAKSQIGEARSEQLSTAIALAIAIAIHNVPEGLAVALPIRQITGSTLRGFIYGSLSGISEPIFGVASFYLGAALEQVTPWGLAFAGGSLVFVVFDDLIPESWTLNHHRISTWSAIAGFIFILILDVAVGE